MYFVTAFVLIMDHTVRGVSSPNHAVRRVNERKTRLIFHVTWLTLALLCHLWVWPLSRYVAYLADILIGFLLFDVAVRLANEERCMGFVAVHHASWIVLMLVCVYEPERYGRTFMLLASSHQLLELLMYLSWMVVHGTHFHPFPIRPHPNGDAGKKQLGFGAPSEVQCCLRLRWCAFYGHYVSR